MNLRQLLPAILLLGACKQDLIVPGSCPELCPAGQPEIREFLLTADMDGDSTYTGYAGWGQVAALLAATGLPVGEARAWYRFDSRPDSILVLDSLRAYTVDSVVVTMSIVARDSTRGGLVLELYRLPIALDTLDGFSAVDGEMTEASFLDSLAVADSVKRGAVNFVLTGDALDRLVIAPEDSGQLQFGVTVREPDATGIRLGSIAGATPAASMVTYVHADVADTAAQAQIISSATAANGYVIDRDHTLDPTLLYVGGLPASRSILRFTLPAEVLDSANLLRATLELTPDTPLHGAPNDPTGLEVRGVAYDIGAKSTPAFLLRSVKELEDGSSDVVSIDVGAIVNAWTGPNPLARSFYLSLTPEGGSFFHPSFRSTRSTSGAPQLRVTYLVPPAVERP
jgi:hypothetical protein